MKNIFKLTSAAAFMVPLLGFGQVTFTASGTITSPTNSFQALGNAMVNDVISLYSQPADPSPANTEDLTRKDFIQFSYNLGVNAFADSSTGDWSQWNGFSTNSGSDQTLYFRRQTNTAGDYSNDSYFFTDQGADMVFLGNESKDKNKLFLLGWDTPGGQLELGTAVNDTSNRVAEVNTNNSTTPPYFSSVDTGGTNLYLQFAHRNTKANPDVAYQDEEKRFRIWEGVDPTNNNSLTGGYLISILDRGSNLDGDADDVIAFVQLRQGSTPFAPVPEPSTIGALGVVAMAGLLFARRRIKAKSK